MATPIVKWAGGKGRLLPELRARVPAKFNRYMEPFAGGAALFFDLAPEAAFLNDVNADLITTYRAVAEDVETVLAYLDNLTVHRTKYGAVDSYLQVRAQWNARESRSDAARAAEFLYLNRCGFNGLYRVNKAGVFNVPVGKYKDPLAPLPELLRAAAPVLARARLRAGSYREAIDAAGPGDFVYFDPPYAPLNATSFVAYTKAGFSLEDQHTLAADVVALARRGVHVMVSNSDTPLTRTLYDNETLHVATVRAPRAIGGKGADRSDVSELIVTNRG